jgi:fructose-1,6-bisphosphatase II
LNSTPTRNLALELVRVTEAAALSAARFMGRGDKEGADGAAVEAMRLVLNTVDMDGIIVIGEGEKDNAPWLYNGEKLGNGSQPMVDIAVDPIDGTRLLANGSPNSISSVALAPRGTMYNPGPFVYMHKIAVGPAARDAIDINAPVRDNLNNVARALGQKVENVTVAILDRDRHQNLVKEVRACGARIRLLPDGDIAGALMTCMENSGVDVLMGIGGTPEGVMAACALRCMGGNLVGKPFARNGTEKQRAIEMGVDFNQALLIEDLVSSDDVFFAATGVTNGDLLNGVDYIPNGAKTDSLVMRGLTGTIRRIKATHRLDKLDLISSVQY